MSAGFAMLEQCGNLKLPSGVVPLLLTLAPKDGDEETWRIVSQRIESFSK